MRQVEHLSNNQISSVIINFRAKEYDPFLEQS